ncbi:unnamed protein product [Prorocentrum cordatum]|uniref:Uncharacterized protein n=1 Tax=Prorocentrum cordatum TaxID=2364126 RepID=A0ABN9TEY7_9DINO|nr:unnamed protein product [Polarella glacialis]
MVEGTEDVWPTRHELEQWLVRSAGEVDAAACALRKLLQSNPGLSTHLTTDGEIAGIVQLFAKRFRTRIIQAETPIQITTLYQPLCEVIWRVIGAVFQSCSQLGGGDGAGGQPQSLLAGVQKPIMPHEAHGQLRVLLKTNEDLSIKLSEARRSYLRELAQHRDRQRTLSPEAVQLLQNLKEQPVMFYEPLETVLDDSTKAFVREVVEERIKLGLQTGGGGDDSTVGLNAQIRTLEKDWRRGLRAA